MSKSRGNLVFVSALRHSDVDPMAIRLTLLAPPLPQRLGVDRRRALGLPSTCSTAGAARSPSAPAQPAAPVVDAVLAALADDLDAPAAVAAVDAWADATLGTHGLAETGDPDAAAAVRAVLDAALGLAL